MDFAVPIGERHAYWLWRRMTNEPPEKDDRDATSDAAAEKAPDNGEHEAAGQLADDPRQRPGGKQPARAEVGMSAIHPDEVPGVSPEGNPAALRERDRKEPGSGH
jgi:hypothetical protein